MSNHDKTSLMRMPMAGLLAWLIPGLGHIYLGHRGRGLVCLVAITVTFWTGVAIGGVRSTIDPHKRKLWFVAQLCTAGNTMAGYALHRSIASNPSSDSTANAPAHWVSADVGIHYTGVAGLLNLLVIFDAIARAEPSPTARRDDRRRPGGVA
ncbi:MAG: DUF6677 family protein [Phycisphaerae bacterium]